MNFVTSSCMGIGGATPAAASDHRAGFVELEAWKLRQDLRRIAVAEVAQEVRLDPPVGKELGVDLRVVEAGHAADVEPDGARGEHEIGALERAVAECDRFG